MIALDGPYCVYIHGAGSGPRLFRWSCPRRILTHYLLVCSKNGSEQIVVAGKEYAVPPNGCYLVPPNTLADIGSREGNTPVWVHFDVSCAERRTKHPGAGPFDSTLKGRAHLLQPSPQAVWGIELPVLVPEALRAFFGRALPGIVANWRRGDRISTLEANHQLAGLLLTLVAAEFHRADKPVSLELETRLQRAEAVAQRSLDAGFGVTAFAAAANFSRSRFSKLYQAVRGISPGAFLRQERMRQAERLLLESELPLANIGAMVGYRDATVFGRAFRAGHGFSPSQWRARARQEKG